MPPLGLKTIVPVVEELAEKSAEKLVLKTRPKQVPLKGEKLKLELQLQRSPQAHDAVLGSKHQPSGPRPGDMVLGSKHRKPTATNRARTSERLLPGEEPRIIDEPTGQPYPQRFQPTTPKPQKPPSAIERLTKQMERNNRRLQKVIDVLDMVAGLGLNPTFRRWGEEGSAAIEKYFADAKRARDLAKTQSPKTIVDQTRIEVPPNNFIPGVNTGYDYLPESPQVPGSSFEVPFPSSNAEPGTWTKVKYDINLIKYWYVDISIVTGEVRIIEMTLPPIWTVELELLQPQSFGLDIATAGGGSSAFGGAYYVKAKGIRGLGRYAEYQQITKIWLPAQSDTIARFEGNGGKYPRDWDITSSNHVHFWFSPSGVTVENLRIIPPLPTVIVLAPRIPTPKKEKQDKEEMPCDLSSIQQLLRYNIAQNTQIQASVNGANLGINANIDTLKPPINATLSNTNNIASNVGELLNITGTTQTTVNSTATTANAIKQGVDTIPPKLNGIQSALDDIGPKTNSIKSTVDAMAPKIDDIKDGIGAIGRRIEDVWNKLGDIAQQIGDRFDKLARWLRLPQLLSALTLIVTLHNAAMLSNNLIQSLGEIIDIGLNVIGLKDENDQAFSISEILGKNANSLAATILGESNWNTTKEAWKKINNIYRAGANIIYSIQSICESMINILQIGAEATGKIGNALRKAGVVAENAYGWLPEQINLAIAQQTAFRGVLNQLRSLSDTTDSLQSAVSETRNIQTEFNELKEKKDKFDLELNKVTTAKSTAESTSKTHSQSPTINSSDLKPSS